VIASATTKQRRMMHLRLSKVVEDLEQRAQHLAHGTTEPEESVARLLEDGAAAARARGGASAAAGLLERARELTPPGNPVVARERGIRAADLHSHAGDRTHARRLLDALLAESLAPAQRVEALRLRAELSLVEEDLEGCERQLLDAIALTEDPDRRARLHLVLTYVVSLSMDWERSAVVARRALADLTDSDDGPLLAEALTYSANADLLVGRAVDWSQVERALELEDPDRIGLPGLPPSGVAAMLMIFVSRHDEGRQLLRMVCQRLSERGDEADLAHALLWLSWCETRSGHFATAAQYADDAITCAAQTGNLAMGRWALAQRAWSEAHLGDLEAARRHCVEAAAPHPRGITQVELWIAATLAMAASSEGDPSATWQASRALTEVIEQRGMLEPVAVMFLPDALEALIALGELDRAEKLLEAFEARSHEPGRGWAVVTAGRCRGLLLAERGEITRAIAAIDRTLTEQENLDLPFERARTLLVKGMLERRARRRARAARALDQAAGEFARMGAKVWLERARSELERVGGRRPKSPGELSASEQRVAELAGSGLSNKEIAAALFISVHTVEVHLSRVYAKLGVPSRARLAERLRGTR
jgi:DNA-binding CsgD family transcriptional regulator/tetratricopeptide (TPR) repeat protein